MNNDADKSKEQLLAEIEELRKKSKEQEDKLKAANQQLDEHSQQLQATEQQLRAGSQQLTTSEVEFKNLSLLKKAILESPVGIVVFALDKNYCYLYFTPLHKQTMKAIWDVDIEIGDNMLDYIKFKSDREKSKKNFDRALKGEQLVLYEEYGDEKLKRTFYEDRYSPVYDENNNIIGLSVYVVDITERKQAEDKLIESEKRFRKMFNNHAAIMLLIDPESGAITDANTAAQIFYGYSHQQLCALKIHEINQLSNDEVNKEIQNAQNEQRNYFIFSHKLKNGQICTVEVRSTPIEVNNKKMLFSIVQDITEHKQAELALQKSEEKFRAIAQTASDAIISVDSSGKIMVWNHGAEQIFGYSKQEISGKPLTLLMPERFQEAHKKGFDRVNSGEDIKLIGKTVEVVGIRKDGQEFPMELSLSKWEIGDELYFSAVIRDITERKRVEEKLKASEIRLKQAEKIAHLGCWELNLTNDVLTWSDEVFRIFDLKPQKLKATYEAFLDNIHPDDREKVNEAYTNSLKTKTKTNYEIEHRILLKNGKLKYVLEKCRTEYDDTGKPIRSIGTVLDITERKQAEEELRVSEEKFRKVFSTSLDSININRLEDGMFISVNNGFTKITGYSESDVIGKTTLEVNIWLNPGDREKLVEGLRKYGQVQNLEAQFRMKGGKVIYGLISAALITLDGVPHIISITRDITERKLNEEKIKHLATHDPLTNLPSLRLVNDRISLAMESTKRKQLLTGVLFVDLDEFKNLNDTYGHNAGDAVLQEVAKRLVSCVRKTDTVGRIGGDEFLVVVTEFQNTDIVESIAKKIINTLSQPMICNGVQLIVTASIGIAIYPTDCNSAEGLIKKSDGAMYVSKKSGKNQFTFANAKKSI